MSNRSDTRFRALSKTTIWIHLIQLGAVVETDIRKLKHDPSELFTRMIQPIIWLLIFGQAMASIRLISTGDLPYIDYMTPGILAQGILYISIFYGISLIWERDMGVLYRILVTPTPRTVLALGRAVAGGVRALPQVLLVYLLAFFLGVDLSFHPLSILGVCAMSVLGGALFSTFSLIIALIVKKRERFLGIGQALTLPLFFASNALYPIDLMPTWIRGFSIINPLTYQVDTLRALMIKGHSSHFGIPFDFAITIAIFLAFLLIASANYRRILY